MRKTRLNADRQQWTSVEDPASGPTVHMSSTEAQNRFGRVLDAVARGETVVITQYGVRKAVVLSVADYQALTGANFDKPRVDLDSLAKEFDELVLQMQTPEAREGVLRMLRSSPEELARIAFTDTPRGKEHGPVGVSE